MRLHAKHHLAAKLMADKQLSDDGIARQVQVHRSTLMQWRQRPDFRALVSRLRDAQRDKSGQDGRLIAKIRGVKLQMAIQLIAEQHLTDTEIASRIQIKPGTLDELKRESLFVRRVEETRRILVAKGFDYEQDQTSSAQ